MWGGEANKRRKGVHGIRHGGQVHPQLVSSRDRGDCPRSTVIRSKVALQSSLGAAGSIGSAQRRRPKMSRNLRCDPCLNADRARTTPSGRPPPSTNGVALTCSRLANRSRTGWQVAASDHEHWLERRIVFLLDARP